jgi:cystathionine beta-lyase/cystathionine gamma-synthase
MNLKKSGLGTRCIHAGEDKHGKFASLTTDIAQTAVFAVPDVEGLRQIVSGKSGNFYYSRNANPTNYAAEEKIAALEDAAGGAVITSSGMSAILCAALSVCKAGDEIVSMLDVYGGTIKLFEVVLAGLGIRTHLVPYKQMGKLEKYFNARTKLLFLESPTNPTLRSVDLAALIKLGHERKLKVMVDNTFATPVLQQPHHLGADIVMHSATKYLGGHSDISAGAVTAMDVALVAKMRDMCVATGGNLDPGAAWLLIRGLKTLEIRVWKGTENAGKLAAWLGRQKKIKRVMYPGLKGTEGHEFAKQQMRGYGSMVSVNVAGGGRAAERFINSLKLWYLATSLGGVESTVSYPVLASHVNCSQERLKLLDVSPATVRLSVGIEDSKDLIADLDQALNG